MERLTPRTWWNQRVVPRLTDASLRGHDVGERRALACAGLAGEVVEIGFGSGLNVRWYPPEVTDVVAVEPSDRGWELSAPRRARSRVPITRGGLDGEHLDLPDGSRDAALVTFSLCTIPDPVQALRELRRVVRPGGRVHFLEHGLSPEPGVARWQQRLDPIEIRVAGGCHLTRVPEEMLEAAGWRLDLVQHGPLPGPRVSAPWTWLTWGTAS